MDTCSFEILPNLSEILEDFFSDHGYPKEVMQSTKQMFYHIMPEHYFTTKIPSQFPKFCKIIKPTVTEEQLEMAITLGWIYQMIHEYFIGLDDHLDSSDVRYGKPTWSKLHGHEKSLIVSDLSVLRSIVFFTLRKKFSHLPSKYLQLQQLFLDADIMFSKGIRLQNYQHIGNLRMGKVGLDSFNMDSYKLINHLQLSAFFYLPLALVMTICDYEIEKHLVLYSNLEDICDDMGNVIKICDDYNEIFNHSIDNDCSDADIREGQYTWLFLMLKESCDSEDEIMHLLNHYGKDSNESVNYVKELLEKIGIHELFRKYRKQLVDCIMGKANSYFGEDKKIREMFLAWFEFWKKFMC